jgi:hypothetical protein
MTNRKRIIGPPTTSQNALGLQPPCEFDLSPPKIHHHSVYISDQIPQTLITQNLLVPRFALLLCITRKFRFRLYYAFSRFDIRRPPEVIAETPLDIGADYNIGGRNEQ